MRRDPKGPSTKGEGKGNMQGQHTPELPMINQLENYAENEMENGFHKGL